MLSRCGVGNSSTDINCQTNLLGAQNVGLKTGVYHFVYPLPEQNNPSRNPKAQAQAHYKAAGDIKVVACDLEWPVPSDWQRWGCSANQICDWELTYLQEYERISGARPLIYTYPDFAHNIKFPANFGTDYKLWIASIATTPAIFEPWQTWSLWQRSGGTEKLPNGVPVDVDVAQNLDLWNVQPAPADPEPPPPMEVIPVVPVPVAPIVPSPQPPTQTDFISSVAQFVTGLFKR
jgi:lysozyme